MTWVPNEKPIRDMLYESNGYLVASKYPNILPVILALALAFLNA
jgi:hypothetical protein